MEQCDPRGGEIAVPEVVPRLSGAPGNIDWLGEWLGAQNDEIFGGLLDLSAAEIRALRADK